MYLWSHFLLPSICGKSNVNPQFRDWVLQLVERLASESIVTIAFLVLQLFLPLFVSFIGSCLGLRLDLSYWMVLWERESACFHLLHLICWCDLLFLLLLQESRLFQSWTLHCKFTCVLRANIYLFCRLPTGLLLFIPPLNSWLLLVLLELKLQNKHHSSFYLTQLKRCREVCMHQIVMGFIYFVACFILK